MFSNLNTAPIQQYSVFNDRQAKSCTSHFTTAAFIYAIEALKDAGQMLSRDANTIVLESKMPMVL